MAPHSSLLIFSDIQVHMYLPLFMSYHVVYGHNSTEINVKPQYKTVLEHSSRVSNRQSVIDSARVSHTIRTILQCTYLMIWIRKYIKGYNGRVWPSYPRQLSDPDLVWHVYHVFITLFWCANRLPCESYIFGKLNIFDIFLHWMIIMVIIMFCSVGLLYK